MAMFIYGNNGEKFHTSHQEWGGITYAIKLTGFEVPNTWYFYDGKEGLKNLKDCNTLAKNLKNFLKGYEEDLIREPMEDFSKYKNLKCFVEVDTENTVSPYYTTKERLQEFIKFLQNCNGFKIY